MEFGRDSSAGKEEEEGEEKEEEEGEIEECEEALERYELDYEEALEQLRDDIFDVRLDRLEDAYEKVLQEGENDQEELDRLCWEEVEDLVLSAQHWSLVVIHPRKKR